MCNWSNCFAKFVCFAYSKLDSLVFGMRICTHIPMSFGYRILRKSSESRSKKERVPMKSRSNPKMFEWEFYVQFRCNRQEECPLDVIMWKTRAIIWFISSGEFLFPENKKHKTFVLQSSVKLYFIVLSSNHHLGKKKNKTIAKANNRVNCICHTN